MNKAWRYTLFALVIILAVAVVVFFLWIERSNPASMDSSDAELVARGGALYAEHCARCHGAELEGQPDWRQRMPNGRLPAPPHDASGHTWHHTAEQLFGLTKFGLGPYAPEGYESDMPAFEGELNDEEIWAVLSFIKSRWPEEIRRRYDETSAQAE
jgi:mono/diheme cytochrome c family protein